MTIMILTRIVETDVLGCKAYHVDCDCGFKSQRYDREATALRHAKKHTQLKHGA
jgi:hypothetical protein